jgi:hypothetical protein
MSPTDPLVKSLEETLPGLPCDPDCGLRDNQPTNQTTQMKKLLTMIGLAAATLAGVQGQLLQWNTFGNAGTETAQSSVFNDINIAASSLSFGVGVAAAANGNRFGGNGWFDTGDTNPTTLVESIAGNDYIEFVITPNVGATFTLTSFVFSWEHSATGPGSLTLRSSADSFASDIGSVTGLAASLTAGNVITVSGFADYASAVTFRLYGYGATSGVGTGGFDTTSSVVNVQVNGTAVPEPRTFLLIGIGFCFVLWSTRRRRRLDI